MNELLTVLGAQVPLVVGALIWWLKNRAGRPSPTQEREASMADRFIGYLEKQSDISSSVAKVLADVDRKQDLILKRLNGLPKKAA
jgi:hypothetical protein